MDTNSVSESMITRNSYCARRYPFERRDGASVWPDNARLAVIIELTPETWEWNRNEPNRVHGSISLPDESKPSLSTQTAVEYGFEVGMPRLLNLLDELGVIASAPTNGLSAIQFPNMIEDFYERGHEILGHGYSQGIPMTVLSRDKQRSAIDSTVRAIEGVIGERPCGWLSPALLCNIDTIDLLLEAGFRYHCDLQDDELPYFLDKDDNTLVEIPYRIIGNTSDLTLFANPNTRTSPTNALAFLTEMFDAYYTVAADSPLIFVQSIHPFVSGRPDTSLVLTQFIEYIQSHEDIWFTTFREIAEWWDANFEDGYPL